jgi:hypothetical protein
MMLQERAGQRCFSGGGQWCTWWLRIQSGISLLSDPSCVCPYIFASGRSSSESDMAPGNLLLRGQLGGALLQEGQGGGPATAQR